MAWQQHFDSSDWDIEFNISWEEFPSEHWECTTAATNTGLDASSAGWWIDYRPTLIRVTYTGDPISQLTLVDTNSDQIAVKVSYTSGEEIAINFGSYNLDRLFFAKGGGNDVDITNIEFYSGISTSLSSSSKSSSSSSSFSSSSSLSSSSKSSSSSSSSSNSSSSRSSSSSSSSAWTSSSSSKSSSLSSSSSSSSSSKSSSSSSSSKSSSSSSVSYTPFSQDIKMDITITKSSQIWGYVRDWRGHIVRKICKIVISSLDGSQVYAITESNLTDGFFSTKINLSTGSSVLLTCFYEGTFRGQYNLAGSIIVDTGSSSSSFSSSSSSSSSRSSSSSSNSSSSSSFGG